MAEKLLDAIRASMKCDIRRLGSLRPGMSDHDLMIKPVAWFAISRCLSNENLEAKFIISKCLSSESLEARKLYFSSCWIQHVDLSLALWNAIKLGLTSAMDNQLIMSWAYAQDLLWQLDCAFALFEGAKLCNGRPFHDPESPSLSRFLNVLDLQGHVDLLCKFKHNAYVVTALLVLHAQDLQRRNESSDPIVSSNRLEAAFLQQLEGRPNPKRAEFFKVLLPLLSWKWS